MNAAGAAPRTGRRARPKAETKGGGAGGREPPPPNHNDNNNNFRQPLPLPNFPNFPNFPDFPNFPNFPNYFFFLLDSTLVAFTEL